MPNWKKVVVSGSDALISHLTASGGIKGDTITGTVATATQATIDHDSLANFVADEHVVHGDVSVIAGTGLTGGGTIAANRTLNVVGGNGITANANDIAITAAQTTITSIFATDLKIGEDAQTAIDFETANQIHLDANNAQVVNVRAGGIEVVGDITSSAAISASGFTTPLGTVSGLSGSFTVLTGDTSVGTSLEVGGPITGSAFQGTKHILRSRAFYVNDNPMVQNSLYFGNTIGNSPHNWNDPQAAGGAITSTNSFTIAEDDMNWGYILPFDISAVEVQCSLRPGLGDGDDFTLAIYTGVRNNASNTALTLTKVANSSGIVFDAGEYVTNDITYTANLDKGTLIYVGVGSEDATDAKNARGLMNITIIAR